MSLRTAQNMSIAASLTPVFTAAAAAGDSFANTGKIFVYFKNANVGVSRIVTIHSQVLCNQGVEHDVTITVPASSEEMMGFFSMDRFNDASGLVQMTYDSEADLTLAVVSAG